MTLPLYDLTFILYMLIIFFSVFGSGLFVFWWIKLGEASSVYSYVTAFLLGSTVNQSIEAYARYLFLVDSPEASDIFCMSAVWPLRLVIWLMALAAMVTHMAYRVFIQKYTK